MDGRDLDVLACSLANRFGRMRFEPQYFEEDEVGNIFGACFLEVFLLGMLTLSRVAPTGHRARATEADAFDDEIGFEMYLNATALEDITFAFAGDLKDGAFAGHVSRTTGSVWWLARLPSPRSFGDVGSLLKIGARAVHPYRHSVAGDDGAGITPYSTSRSTGISANQIEDARVRLGLSAGDARWMATSSSQTCRRHGSG